VAPAVHAIHSRAPARRIVLKAAGIDGDIPLVQEGKRNTEVQSFLFYRKNTAVIKRVILEQKWQAPQLHDHYNLVCDALVPMRTLIERTQRGETTLSEFFVEQLTCNAEWKRMRGAGNAIASELLWLFDLRFATTGDSLLHELAYVFTPDDHARFQMMKRSGSLRLWSERCPTRRSTCSPNVCLSSPGS
jgi:hypothetical protein